MHDFWADLAKEFSALHNEEVAESHDGWLCAMWSSNGQTWHLGGSTSKVRSDFTLLAQRAAAELGHPSLDSALQFWLDSLMNESAIQSDDRYYKGAGEISVNVGDGWRQGITRTLQRVCEASADYCQICATRQRITSNVTTIKSSEAGANNAFIARATAVQKVKEELQILLKHVYSLKDFEEQKQLHPDYLTFAATDKDPSLKDAVRECAGSPARLHLAYKIVGTLYGISPDTVETSYKRFKPGMKIKPKAQENSEQKSKTKRNKGKGGR